MTASSASTTTVRSSWPLLNALSIFLLVLLNHIKGAHTASPKKFVVFGSSGKTGLSIVNRILSENIADCQVICPVRNMAKARAVLGPESKTLSLVPCDLLKDKKGKIRTLVAEADAVIICSAYSPGNVLHPQLSTNWNVMTLNTDVNASHMWRICH